MIGQHESFSCSFRQLCHEICDKIAETMKNEGNHWPIWKLQLLIPPILVKLATKSLKMTNERYRRHDPTLLPGGGVQNLETGTYIRQSWTAMHHARFRP